MRYTDVLVSDSLARCGRAKESLLWVFVLKMVAVHIPLTSYSRLRVRLDVHPANLAHHAFCANDWRGHALRLLARKFKEKRITLASAMKSMRIGKTFYA